MAFFSEADAGNFTPHFSYLLAFFSAFPSPRKYLHTEPISLTQYTHPTRIRLYRSRFVSKMPVARSHGQSPALASLVWPLHGAEGVPLVGQVRWAGAGKWAYTQCGMQWMGKGTSKDAITGLIVHASGPVRWSTMPMTLCAVPPGCLLARPGQARNAHSGTRGLESMQNLYTAGRQTAGTAN